MLAFRPTPLAPSPFVLPFLGRREAGAMVNKRVGEGLGPSTTGGCRGRFATVPAHRSQRMAPHTHGAALRLACRRKERAQRYQVNMEELGWSSK